jgi:uncharacterized protein (DUF427 family)
MKAIWNNKIVAESNATIPFEGNHCFPPDVVKIEFFDLQILGRNCCAHSQPSSMDP